MKILKKAEQKNIILNKEYYNIYQVNSLLDQHIIFYIDSNHNVCYDNVCYDNEYMFGDVDFRLFTDDLKEIKVELDEYNYYTAVAVHNNGNKYYVSL